MSEIDNITTKVVNEIDTEDKKININLPAPLTPEQVMAIQSIKRLKNPFKMLGIKDVMRDGKHPMEDLKNICETIAYRTFKRADFPSINIGKSNQVMLLSYLIWKMNKRV